MKNSKYEINESNILFTELGDEGVILDLEKNEYLNLNETYLSIFKKLQEKISTQEIVNQLLEEFEVDRETCEKEVMEVIQDLMKRGYLYETAV